ncbi:MAG: hypothetical protein FD188_2838 [Ignavibacteria bacterium]|nr:MAG: hypothetical protein FD188_2838 [Ignavibacteria bacterium]
MKDFHRALKVTKVPAEFLAVEPRMKKTFKSFMKILGFFDQNLDGKLTLSQIFASISRSSASSPKVSTPRR